MAQAPRTCAKHRKLAQHAHSHGSHAYSHGSHAFTHTLISTWLQPRGAKRLAQLLFFSACWVFSCFRNPPNSDMDYRIFNVRTCSLLCLRIHTRVGHTDTQRVSTTFLTRKNSKKCLLLLTGFKPLSFGSSVRRSTN